MSYDYDGWKLSTPWDDEKEISVSFTCTDCEEWNEDVSTIVGGSMYWELECSECGARNSGDESEY
jgi:transcription elongation factor Elf1